MTASSRLEVWEHEWVCNGGTILADGWTRLVASDAADTTISLWFNRVPHSMAWLAQANHIFRRLGISSNFENYVLLNSITFQLTVSATTAYSPPKGYLFLCPPKDFKSDALWSFRWPNCPAYWSLSPSSAERLGTEDAADLGFPSVLLSSTVAGRSWDASVYAGLCQFHLAKGFDPESEDLVRYLDRGFYQLSNETTIELTTRVPMMLVMETISVRIFNLEPLARILQLPLSNEIAGMQSFLEKCPCRRHSNWS
ncbi:hypothetical protein B0H12DRAFT_458593 [Mycena haematopus]|nr:hypothetical protein B0H12DRAFT_458593 [Mycena haematopus]